MTGDPKSTVGNEDAGDEGQGRVGRRRLIYGAAAAAAGLAVGAAAEGGTADAATGGDLILGKANTATSTTSVKTTAGTGFSATTSAKGDPGLKGTNTSTGGGYGVQGSSAHGTGVYGSTAANGKYGVEGYNTYTGGGYGVYGASTHGTGVHGSTVSAERHGVEGVDTSAGGGYGVHGSSNHGFGVAGLSTSGVGVYASSASTAAGASAVLGTITSSTPGGASAGVRGANDGTEDEGIGVSGSQEGSGWGVYGTTPSGIGVYGDCAFGTGVVGSSSTGPGVSASSNSGVGVQATSSSAQGINATSGTGVGVQAHSTSGYGVYGTSPNNYGVVGVTTSGNGVYGQVSADSQAGIVGRQENASGNWALYGFGNIGATGTKSAVVPAADGDYVTLYCMESPECWFEDFGSASLSAGSASVLIDPTFAHTIETGRYSVFVQAEGDCNGLYVSNKTATGFAVRELGGGKSDTPFSYRIVARRKDVSAPRLNRTKLPDASAPSALG